MRGGGRGGAGKRQRRVGWLPRPTHSAGPPAAGAAVVAAAAAVAAATACNGVDNESGSETTRVRAVAKRRHLRIGRFPHGVNSDPDSDRGGVDTPGRWAGSRSGPNGEGSLQCAESGIRQCLGGGDRDRPPTATRAARGPHVRAARRMHGRARQHRRKKKWGDVVRNQYSTRGLEVVYTQLLCGRPGDIGLTLQLSDLWVLHRAAWRSDMEVWCKEMHNWKHS